MLTEPWWLSDCAAGALGIGSMNTETAARPSENTMCEIEPLLPPIERFASIIFLKPWTGPFRTQPVSAGVAAAPLKPERSTRQFCERLLSAYFDLTRSRLKF